MNVLQDSFFSSAFRVRDDEAFEHDPAIVRLRRHLDIYSGREEDAVLHCIVSKDRQPGTRLRVARPALMNLLEDAKASDIVMEDDCGWIVALQAHLHPDDGIVVMNQVKDGREYQTYIAPDCAGWTRQSCSQEAEDG